MLNQLLAEMDGFESNRGVTRMAAANRPDMLQALQRPGRVDRQIHVGLPTEEGRRQILCRWSTVTGSRSSRCSNRSIRREILIWKKTGGGW